MTMFSAGILLFRFRNEKLEVMLVHPGGPFWANKDDGVWSIPKGLPEDNENPLDTARREFKEETGFEVDGEFIDLGELNQSSVKIVHVWALEKAGWFDIELAKKKIIKGQIGFIDKLIEIINCSQKEKKIDKG